MDVHWPVLEQRLRQVESTQSWPAAHSAPVLQLPGARGRHSPPWQLSPRLQLVSVVQPKKHLLFTHQAPVPQSELAVQVEGGGGCPPLPASGVGGVPASGVAGLPASGVGAGIGVPFGPQKPDWQLQVESQSVSRPHGRVQKPLMQASKPHCELVVQVFAPGGTTRQLPARQNSPAWQSEFLAQKSMQTPPVQAWSALHSTAVAHAGSFEHWPSLQPQVLLQSAVWVQAEPGQPKGSLQNPSPS